MKYLLCLGLLLAIIPAFAQNQGIAGRVEWISGNQMPGPDRPATKAKGIKREIWIYQPTTMADANAPDGVFFSDIKTTLIKKIKSNCKGRFRVKLAPGEYSIFIKEKKGLFANQFDGQNRIHCVAVKPGEFTEITIQVNYEAAY
ncbi:MAG: carboxypeptidase regulatory-like domain-containing protein [Cyclobacteriaceae bacterium]|nr:MAG: carboxypeptidase regulatory-like domain-containing protein [Cyclobacteriaceae bacterium]